MRLVSLIVASVAIAALVEAVPAMDLQRGTHAAVRHPMFRDASHAAGLDFIHVNGASDKRFFPEIMGSGGLFLDFDNDGWLDVFLVDGGSFADESVARRARHRLYRNRGNGTFEDVTAPAASATATTGWAHAPETSTTTA